MKVYLYTLEHPITGEVRYAGKTINPIYKRLKGHLKGIKFNKSHSVNWIKSLLEQNLKPIIKLYDIVDESVWEDEERLMIAQLKEWGFNLTNQQLGGDSKHTLKITQEHKNNISKGLLSSERYKEGIKNRNCNGNKNGFFGKKFTQKSIDKISLTKSKGQVAIYDKDDQIIDIFTSATKASKFLKIHKQTILKRIRKQQKLQLGTDKYVAKYENVK